MKKIFLSLVCYGMIMMLSNPIFAEGFLDYFRQTKNVTSEGSVTTSPVLPPATVTTAAPQQPSAEIQRAIEKFKARMKTPLTRGDLIMLLESDQNQHLPSNEVVDCTALLKCMGTPGIDNNSFDFCMKEYVRGGCQGTDTK